VIFAISMLSRITPHKLLLTAITPSKLRLMLKATASLPFISGLATVQNNLRPATQSVMPFEPTAEFARNGVNVETMS